MKEFLHKYRHAWVVAAYMPVYMVWWMWLENRKDVIYHPVETALDEIIPFTEVFIVPYLLWFVYVAGVVALFFLKDRESYYKSCAFLFIGMTVCLVIYTIWPNVQLLRPTTLPRRNIFTKLVSLIYASDTSTNVCPSIHVYNSIGVHIAVIKSRLFKDNRKVHIASAILMVSICLSTVFLKQHSCFDGACAVLLSFIMYLIVYVPDYKGAYERRTARALADNDGRKTA